MGGASDHGVDEEYGSTASKPIEHNVLDPDGFQDYLSKFQQELQPERGVLQGFVDTDAFGQHGGEGRIHFEVSGEHCLGPKLTDKIIEHQWLTSWKARSLERGFDYQVRGDYPNATVRFTLARSGEFRTEGAIRQQVLYLVEFMQQHYREVTRLNARVAGHESGVAQMLREIIDGPPSEPLQEGPHEV